MKRRVIIALGLLCCLIALGVALSFSGGGYSNAPRFVLLIEQPPGPFARTYYDWADAIPFQHGKMWIWTYSNSTNKHCYLYDLEQSRVIGELLHAGPVYLNQNQTR